MNIKALKIKTIVLLVGLFLTGSLYSCSSNKSKNKSEEKISEQQEVAEGHSHNEMMEEDEHHHEGDEAEAHQHDEMHENSSGELSWQPSGKPFDGQLKLVKGNASQLNAHIVKKDGSNVLSIEPGGQEAIMLLDGSFNNLGAELQYQVSGYKGLIAVLFHYQDEANYDAMVLDNQAMKLIRVEDGNTKVLDSNEARIPSDWSTLKISAAGEHLKCFLNGKQYNHGHAEERPAGKFGILLKGQGTVFLKGLDVVPLEE